MKGKKFEEIKYRNLTREIQKANERIEKLNKKISIRKEQLNVLYEKGKKGEDTWAEVDKLRDEIKSLSMNQSVSADKLTILGTAERYTKEGDNGEIIIEPLPEIENFEVSKALNAMEMTGEERMREETKLDLFYRVAKGDEDAWDRLQNLPKSYNVSKGIEREDIWGEIERFESEVSSLDRKHWKKRREWLRLRATQGLSAGTLSICDLIGCPDPTTPLGDGTYYFTAFEQVKVWVGMYSSSTPDSNYSIDEYCTTTFTTNMTYYWNEAKNRNSNTNSIQIKWFYLATHSEKEHDLIWEGNKNSANEWYTYVIYDDTTPSDGYYGIDTYENHHACCGTFSCHWCNTHCGGCFACDEDRAQHFVTSSP